MIEEEAIKLFLEFCLKVEREKGLKLTFFEFMTMCALRYWEEKQIDLAVMEVGLGGLLDATNVIENKALAIVTSIAMDHKRLLGPTLEDITCEAEFHGSN